ncbi:IclR family transcriptional regulator domain-containing protein [Streptacidiphilus melanogenes]|uniref:IclR family transcriptional regulator domain-containing protein n=1 Tax=Streptacidiphilus melanogenes TaxID=411235 RepID=UPI0005A80AED|nr:IclR family transcriptional regulator C-terminal domain-containing protein [Streptacidiphilus melanogenes]
MPALRDEAATEAPAAVAAEAPAEAVGPLLRGVAVLRALTAAPQQSLTLGELARATGLARATTDRIAATLARLGYLRVDGRTATLAPALMEVGNAYLASVRLPDLLGPLADRLADTLDESVSLAVPDGSGIRFVHQATRRRTLSLSFRIGDLLPLERTAPGPLFAARWSEDDWTAWSARGPESFPAVPTGSTVPTVPTVPTGSTGPTGPTGRTVAAGTDVPDLRARAEAAARDGWALDDQLIESGLVALAVPVHDATGALVCAVSVVSHTSRHSAPHLREVLLPALTAARDEMESVLRAPREQHPASSPTVTPTSTSSPAVSSTGGRSAAAAAVSKGELGADFIESLARGLLVPTAFGADRPELSLSAVAEATGLARATARRALITLEHLGYVTATGRSFRLTPTVLELGYAPLSGLTLADLAAPHLADLVAQVHDSASMAVLDGHDIRYTARVAASRVMSVRISVGTRFPAYATAMGRVLLAALPPGARDALLAGEDLRPLTAHTLTDPAALTTALARTATDGHTVVTDELEEGLRSIAVPIHAADGCVLAAVNVSMHTARRSLAECRATVLPALRAAAARIEADLAVSGRFAPTPVA